ncbi:MAG: CBS domain-containing protein [Clostridia bacterium]|nr:CBS domain-containing protein [Clostridia bacterium]
MNIAFFLKPKISVAFLYNDYTIRQSLEKMCHYGYSAIPVINREGRYVGTVSEGDFLWYLTDCFSNNEDVNLKTLEELPLSKILKQSAYKPMKVTADVNELITLATKQNFVPVVDDLGSFIGIVTRRDIIKHLTDNK